MARLFYCLILS